MVFDNQTDEDLRKSQVLNQEQLRNAMDAEVQRVSDLFRFVLKFKRHFQPSGVEFSGLRQYLPSDDASRIDWKISAEKPDLFVKQFDEEIDMDAFMLIDVSDTMTFGTAEKLKSEYAAIVSAALGYASIDAGINVGFGLYGENMMTHTPAGGMDQYNKMLTELSDYENYGGTLNLEDALDEVIGQIKEDAAIFIISDFIDLEGDWKTKMQLADMKFRHVMTIMCRDLRDYKLPESGNIRFESPDGSDKMVVATNRVKKEFERAAAEQEKEIENRISEGGSSFIKIDTRDNFSAKFAEFFDRDQGSW